MSLHAFVVMPFGVKQGIDFNQVFADYLRPALEDAGFEVFRADQEQRAGDIRSDMFQELLLADLVVADLSIDNPNAWYELGVRHALRARGTVQVQCQRDYMPFDVYGDRTLRYGIKNGAPDPDTLTRDRAALAAVAAATVRSWRGRRISPVYSLIPALQEPNWKALRVGGVAEFWDAFERWEDRIKIAQRRRRAGDILVYTTEVPAQVLRQEAHHAAAVALREMGHFPYALKQIDESLEVDPSHVPSLRLRGTLLEKLGRLDEAQTILAALAEQYPGDAENWAALGRTAKVAWERTWRPADEVACAPETMTADAAAEEGLLEQAIAPYLRGFRVNPAHYYSGINALTLLHLLRHLTGRTDQDAEIEAVTGGVAWAVDCALDRDERDFWALATHAEVTLLSQEPTAVRRAYRRAAAADKNWFTLTSARQQVVLLRDLQFRPEAVGPALAELDRALARPDVQPPWLPRRVVLFTGHMIDKPERALPRFPADREDVAAAAIAARLDALGVGPDDLAVCSGACGGDLLFAEAALARGMRLQVHIALDEPQFLQESVAFAGERWQERYYRVTRAPGVRLLRMPDELGPLPPGVDAFSRNNRWMLYTSLALGPDKVHFIALWNGEAGDGPGGTRDMLSAVREHLGQITILDTKQLW